MLRVILLGVVLFSLQALAYPQAPRSSHDSDIFEKMIGVEEYAKLSQRLNAVNMDIQKRGIHDFPESRENS